MCGALRNVWYRQMGNVFEFVLMLVVGSILLMTLIAGPHL